MNFPSDATSEVTSKKNGYCIFGAGNSTYYEEEKTFIFILF